MRISPIFLPKSGKAGSSHHDAVRSVTMSCPKKFEGEIVYLIEDVLDAQVKTNEDFL